MASWFSEGTVSVTNGNATVTGVGTKFSNCRSGDMFVGPDNGIYQVVNPSSDTSVSISPAYRGATAAGASYGIVPVNGYPKALADAVNLMVQQWGATLAGLGPVASMTTVPIANGGTGGTSQASARAGLGLGTAATATIGTAAGNVMAVGAFGIGGGARNVQTNPDSSAIGGGMNYYTDTSGGSSQANNRFGIKFALGAGLNQGFELLNDPWNPKLYFRYSSSSAGAPWYAPLEIYHTGNTTRAQDGTLKAI